MSAIHYVNQSNSTIQVGTGNIYSITGDDDLVLVGASSVASVQGFNLNVQVSGASDSIAIGGDGQFAPDSREDIVAFAASGTITELPQSRVDVTGSQVTATVDGYDTFGLYGSGDNVLVKGVQNGLWIGQNGVNATGAALDVVTGLTDSALYEMFGSNVVVSGDDYTALVNGDDILTATGSGVTIKGVGLNNVVNVSGAQSGDVETITLANGGAVYAYGAANGEGVSNLDVFGDHVTLHGFLTGGELIGSADTAVLSNEASGFRFGGNGESGALDLLQTPGGFFTSTEVVANSNVRIVSSGLAVTADGHDRVTVVGNAQEDYDTVGGNIFNLSTGFGGLNESDLRDYAHLRPGDVVNLLPNSELTVFTTGTTTPAAIVATIGANDTLSVVDPGVTVHVPIAAGKSALGFNATDRLVLASHFSSVADLLNHTTTVNGAAVIALDSSGDQLGLSLTKAQVGTYATKGIIKFA